jgi:hypothetical protein
MTRQTGTPVVYTAQSKREFYCRDAVCEFVFRQGAVPLHPFRAFDYFLNDRVPRETIRRANHEVLKRCDELWVFGLSLADGVIVEISQAMLRAMPVKFFTIDSLPSRIRPVDVLDLEFELEVAQKTSLLRGQLLDQLRAGHAHELVRALGRSSELAD